MLDPAYLAGLDARSVDQLRAKHAECLELETEVSYVRRLIQARIDILEAELVTAAPAAARSRTSSARCPRSSPTPARAGNPASSRLPQQMAPEQDSEWAPDLAAFDGVLANLPDAQRRRAP